MLCSKLPLSRPQKQHVVQVADALITTEGSKTLSALYRSIVGDPCPNARKKRTWPSVLSEAGAPGRYRGTGIPKNWRDKPVVEQGRIWNPEDGYQNKRLAGIILFGFNLAGLPVPREAEQQDILIVRR